MFSEKNEKKFKNVSAAVVTGAITVKHEAVLMLLLTGVPFLEQ